MLWRSATCYQEGMAVESTCSSFPNWHAACNFQVYTIKFCSHIHPPLLHRTLKDGQDFTLFSHKLAPVLGSVLSPHAL